LKRLLEKVSPDGLQVIPEQVAQAEALILLQVQRVGRHRTPVNGNASRRGGALARSYGHIDAFLVGTEVGLLVDKTSEAMTEV